MATFVALAALVLGIWALVDCLRSLGASARGLPVPVWVAVILLLPVVGALAWFAAGRVRRGAPPAPGAPVGAPRGPDDDVDFLRSLDQRRGEA